MASAHRLRVLLKTRRIPQLISSFRITALFLLFMALTLGSCKGSGNAGQGPGQIAPEITGIGLNGKPASLSDYSGKVILLNFWATWCGPCVEELPALERVYEKLKDSGFVVIGVAIDDTESDVIEYRDQYKLTFPLIIDHSGLAKRSYGIQGVPETFVLDSKRSFMMVTDPQDFTPITRFVGPREWDSPQVVKILTELLKTST